jgi:hypothetical protein
MEEEGMRHSVCREVLPHFDRRHKAIAMAVHRVQEAWRPSTVSQCLADGHDARVQGGIANELLGPHVLEELGLGNDTVAVGEQVGQHLKPFGAEVDPRPSAVQLIALRVQDIVVKEIAHHPALLVNLRARRASEIQ